MSNLSRGTVNDRIADQELRFEQLAAHSRQQQSRPFDSGTSRHVRLAVTAVSPSSGLYPGGPGDSSLSFPPDGYSIIFGDWLSGLSLTNRQNTAVFTAFNATPHAIQQGSTVVVLQQNGKWFIIAAIAGPNGKPSFGSLAVRGGFGGGPISIASGAGTVLWGAASLGADLTAGGSNQSIIIGHAGYYCCSLNLTLTPAWSPSLPSDTSTFDPSSPVPFAAVNLATFTGTFGTASTLFAAAFDLQLGILGTCAPNINTDGTFAALNFSNQDLPSPSYGMADVCFLNSGDEVSLGYSVDQDVQITKGCMSVNEVNI